MNTSLKLALALTTMGATMLANAQELYNPTRSVKDQGMILKSWGSGTIAETDETGFEGATSIRVSSRNYFQGGIVNYSTPVDLKGAFDNKDNLLQFTLHIPTPTVADSGGGGGQLGSNSGGKSGGAAAGGASGAGGTAGAGGGEGTASGGGTGGGTGNVAAKLTSSKSIETLRLVVTTTDGLRSEAFLDLKGKVPDPRGWIKSGIPLQAINGFGRTNKIVQSIALAGDATATFYVGEVAILNDATPVYGELNDGNMNLALGDEKTFMASGYGGSSPLKFEWDFDSADGIQVDATGQVVKRKFRKAGKYKITLTVSDVYGLKKPHSVTVDVEVNP